MVDDARYWILDTRYWILDPSTGDCIDSELLTPDYRLAPSACNQQIQIRILQIKPLT